MLLVGLGKPVRAAIVWLLAATVVLTLVGGWFAGVHGAVSAALGGAIGTLAGLVSGWLAARSNTDTAGAVLAGALRAEAVRIVLMLTLVALTLVTYKQVVAIALIGSWLVTALMFPMAVFARDR